MEFLGGYGSDGGSGDEVHPLQTASNPVAATTHESGAPSSSGDAWSKLPAPKVSAAAVKRVVQYQIPIQRAMLAADSDDEEDGRLAKKAKPVAAKS